MADEKTDAEKIRDLERMLADSKREAAENAQFKARLQETEERVLNEKITAHRTAIKAKFDAAVTSKKILPKIRDRFYTRFEIEGNDVLKIKLDSVEEYIDENPNPNAPRSQVASFSSTGDVIPQGATADVETAVKVRAMVRANGGKTTDSEALIKAGIELFKADKSLAERYRNLPADLVNDNAA